MVVSVTPGAVAPPLSVPLGHGATHGGAYTMGTRMRLVLLSQLALDSAASVPTPGYADPAATAGAADADAARGAAAPRGTAALLGDDAAVADVGEFDDGPPPVAAGCAIAGADGP